MDGGVRQWRIKAGSILDVYRSFVSQLVFISSTYQKMQDGILGMDGWIRIDGMLG